MEINAKVYAVANRKELPEQLKDEKRRGNDIWNRR